LQTKLKQEDLMKQLKIDHELGTIWLGILPEPYSYPAEELLAYTVQQTQPSEIKDERRACLKVTVHGWNHSTGLLGMNFVPQDTTQLDIRVGVLSKAMIPNAPVQIGLTKTHAQGVLDELIMYLAQNDILGSGTLTVNHAAYDPIYSNDRFFRALAKSALLLLNFGQGGTVDENEIIATVEESIKDAFANPLR
jgi:hypothetical protein